MAAGTSRWRRGLAVGFLGLGALWAVVTTVADWAEAERLHDDGVEVVAEVVEVRNNRSLTGYDDTEVAFDLPNGASVRTEVATQVRPTLPVLRIRYDPDHPTTAEAAEDPAPLWLEDALIALALGGLAVVVAYRPRLTAWRDRRGDGGGAAVS